MLCCPVLCCVVMFCAELHFHCSVFSVLCCMTRLDKIRHCIAHICHITVILFVLHYMKLSCIVAYCVVLSLLRSVVQSNRVCCRFTLGLKDSLFRFFALLCAYAALDSVLTYRVCIMLCVTKTGDILKSYIINTCTWPPL